MTSLPADPGRFTCCRESWLATIVRTFGIALAVATLVCFARFRHLPSTSEQWRGWFAWIVFVAWISFGGHWVELFYLNALRARLATWSDAALICLRIVIWLIGGALLFVGAIVSLRMVMVGEVPPERQILGALLRGGPIFVAIELIVHAFLAIRGRPSFWNRRG